MRKIPTIFQRDWKGDPSRVLNEPNPECEWVFQGYGTTTRKYDGSCVLIRNGKMFKRREIKPGGLEPPDFELVERDAETGKSVGWVPVGDGPEDKYHREAFTFDHADGTYELLGPKVQGNAEHVAFASLQRHADAEKFTVPRNFAEIRDFLTTLDIEGLVFHHPDGRMAKIKKRDFGLPRKP